MNKRVGVYLVGAAQALLSLSPFVPYVRDNIWAAQTTVNGFASNLATYVGLEFFCLGSLVALLLMDIRETSEGGTEQFRKLLQEYTPLNVRQLQENQFYDDFLGHCMAAQHFVNICYFAPNPPQFGAPQERREYYANMARVMQHRSSVRFRRIIRDTESNRRWALDLIEENIDALNMSISLINDLPAVSQMPLALSVQIVDGQSAWLVAVAEHTGAAIYRDVAIENEILVEALGKYFERLWDIAKPVFEPGFTLDQSRSAINRE